MKNLSLAIIAGIALLVAATAGAQVKKTFDGFGAAFDSNAAAHASR